MIPIVIWQISSSFVLFCTSNNEKKDKDECIEESYQFLVLFKSDEISYVESNMKENAVMGTLLHETNWEPHLLSKRMNFLRIEI